MNKAELIDAIASSSELSKVDARKVLEAFVDVTTGVLKSNDRLALVGFGSFGTNQRQKRSGRNPQTGAEITIPSKNVVKFKAGSDLNSQLK